MIGNIKDGGIGFIDMESKLKALKAAWIPRSLDNKHIINDFATNFFKYFNVDIRYISITSELTIRKFNIVQKCPTSTRKFSLILICAKRGLNLNPRHY